MNFLAVRDRVLRHTVAAGEEGDRLPILRSRLLRGTAKSDTPAAGDGRGEDDGRRRLRRD
jgi:hypothetical protein